MKAELKVIGSLILCLFISSCSRKSVSTVWLSPAFDSIESTQRVMVWYENQYLEHGDSFLKKTAKFSGRSRSSVRQEVMSDLKKMSDRSFSKIKDDLMIYEKSGDIIQVTPHWIINGFSATVTKDGLDAIAKLDGVSKIYKKRTPSVRNGTNMGPEYLDNIPTSTFVVEDVESYPWNIKMIRAPEVWRDYGITGEGILNVIHDSGFKLDIPPLAASIYTNTGEIPGNELDDDNNGYIDDYHGYNFDSGSANLNEPTIRRATNIHGNLCAAIVAGSYATGTKQAIGIAPASKWAPLIGSANIEQAVEWAIEHEADTYSMSFSQPHLAEYRTHWRKVMEHGTLCGIVFISGAGNFAAGNAAAPIPVQMRNPEDIPHAVLGVAGVGEDGKRPPFSSQGPVVWDTDHYKDGQVDKPDFSTINYKVQVVDPEGNLSNMANGNSLSGPHMAGIVSLMLSANPELLPWEIKEILHKTAEDIGDEGFDYQSGHGFVNAYDAVKEVLKLRHEN